MKLIAHRVFKDDQPLSRFDPSRLHGFDGAELDLRCDAEGALVVRHAPVFAPARLMRGAKPFAAALEALEDSPGLTSLLLDVKTEAAARQTAAALGGRQWPFELIFACWGAAEARQLRRALPHARILHVAAPIFLDRAPRGQMRELYLTNSFPYLRRAARWRPNDRRRDHHAINIKLISTERLAAALPGAADGVCVHRLLRSPMLEDFAARRGLTLGVYGFPSRAAALQDRRAAGADIVIAALPRRAAKPPACDPQRWLDDASISHA